MTNNKTKEMNAWEFSWFTYSLFFSFWKSGFALKKGSRALFRVKAIAENLGINFFLGRFLSTSEAMSDMSVIFKYFGQMALLLLRISRV